MKRKITYPKFGYVVEFRDDPEIQARVFEQLIAWFRENDIWSGESLCQCDRGNIGAPEVLSEILDETLRPKVTYKE